MRPVQNPGQVTHGLELVERISMPANNLGLVFRR